MRIWKHIFLSLGLILGFLLVSVSSFPDNRLHLIACDVGQGDATLIVYGSTQILIDGGPANKVLDCLGKYMPVWDRTLEAVILTHPDSDHYAGLIEVVKRYKIDNYFDNGLDSSSLNFQVLEKEVGGRGITTYIAKTGTEVRMGKIHLDIVSPDQADSRKDSNDNSLVIDLKYAGFEAILAGDAPKEILNTISVNIPIEYIKLSHHGSKTGTDIFTVERFVPKLAVISVGKNGYGHPNEEVINLLKERNIKYLRTDEEGDIEVESGQKGFLINGLK